MNRKILVLPWGYDSRLKYNLGPTLWNQMENSNYSTRY